MAESDHVKLLWNDVAGLTRSRLLELLKEFGELLPVPLAARLDLAAYSDKLLANADLGVAIVNGEIAGLQAVYANDRDTRCAYLPFIAILPCHREKGLGKAMISRALALARQRGMRRFSLEVHGDNAAARKLYGSFGFRIVDWNEGSAKMQLELNGLETVAEIAATPLQRAPRLATALGIDVDLWIKRDDLFPLPGGGIKARKIGYILKDAIRDGYDVLVTNGGPQSNHARATATIAANLGLQCHLVVVLERGRDYPSTGNFLLTKQSGACIEYCEKGELAERMQRAVDAYAAKGHKPLYIWGGGHCLAGTTAFVEAAREALEQCSDWQPDFLVTASGTGTTQAGLAIGYSGGPTRVIGISVARDKARGEAAVKESIEEYRRANGLLKAIDVDFRDEWTDGGYEHYSEELFNVIEIAARTGIFVCPTYSGKSLRALVDLARRGDIPKGSRVLFWHTGGLLNLQAVDRYVRGSLRL